MKETLADKKAQLHASGWPPVPTDAETIRRIGTSRRRNRRAVVASVAAIGCLALVVPFGVSWLGEDPGNSQPPSNADEANEPGYRPTAGYRGVGALGLIFEVPTTWSDGDIACDGSPRSDTVIFGGGRDCLVPDPPKVSSLRVINAKADLVADAVAAASSSPVTDVDGVSVRMSPLHQADGSWTFAVLAEQGDVVVVATSQDKAILEQIRDTLRAVPEGWIVVPDVGPQPADAAAEQLRGRGFTVRVEDLHAPGHQPGSWVSTDPMVGAVVKQNSSIVIKRATP